MSAFFRHKIIVTYKPNPNKNTITKRPVKYIELSTNYLTQTRFPCQFIYRYIKVLDKSPRHFFVILTGNKMVVKILCIATLVFGALAIRGKSTNILNHNFDRVKCFSIYFLSVPKQGLCKLVSVISYQNTVWCYCLHKSKRDNTLVMRPFFLGKPVWCIRIKCFNSIIFLIFWQL